MQQTSIDAYAYIKTHKLLGPLQLHVFEAVANNGPVTQGEVCDLFPMLRQHSITPRFKELERKGVIRISGKRPCTVTGVDANVYEVTGKLPIDPVKDPRQPCLICQGRGFLDK